MATSASQAGGPGGGGKRISQNQFTEKAWQVGMWGVKWQGWRVELRGHQGLPVNTLQLQLPFMRKPLRGVRRHPCGRRHLFNF
jgi:hypothetical protein